MENEKIIQLVKTLEPLFIGYKAEDNRLKNSNGMELVFRLSWSNKTTVSGLHASHTHSIGCSFYKSPEKIFKDIWKRLMPDYHKDFFEHKMEIIKRKEHEDNKNIMLQAIASVINGDINRNYDYHYSGNSNFVHINNVSIYEHYVMGYEVRIKLDYMATMALAEYLRKSGFVGKKEDL